MSQYYEQAFHTVCKQAQPTKAVFLVLMERVQFYGGPEEGGWWGEDRNVVAYHRFDTLEQAEAARQQVEQLAKDISEQASREYGEQCLREMEWLEARGLEADWLPEPDGPAEYYVTITKDYPTSYRACRHYE